MPRGLGGQVFWNSMLTDVAGGAVIVLVFLWLRYSLNTKRTPSLSLT
ncbi:MAG: hypothetical protein R3E89_19425 [Thiolinea sp.]